MKRANYWLVLLMIPTFSISTFAQVEEEEEEEDYSMYDDYGTDETIKRYCTVKVRGGSPQKLVSLGYDFALPHDVSAGGIGDVIAPETQRAKYYHGLRLSANLPVLSNRKILINVGANYAEARYNFETIQLQNPLHRGLYSDIRTAGINTTIFKPLNEKHFLLGFYMAEYSGDYNIQNLQPVSFIKHTGLAVFGWKFNPGFQFGIGATQSYRAGEVNYFPIIMYNYSPEGKNWGIEALLPARGHFRYRFNSRNLILAGFDLEGTSYHLSGQRWDLGFPANDEPSLSNVENYDNSKIELRRSEIRLNLKYEKALTDFIWISAQAGYAINYRSDVDSGEFFRGFFRDIPYVQENDVAGVPYVQFSINLVSP